MLPTVNALLNATATVLLVLGFRLIRSGRRSAHRRAMLASVAVSALFLVSYLVYHWQAGATRFTGTGAIRSLYFTVLISHTVLAAAVPFLVGATLWAAWRGDFARHRRRARWTLPIWLYVSVTGVAVYLMLYHLPASGW
ncbi:MAG: DUF420 domain-containing protein [Deltaproteobacteria bacterium]|nr:MAG: DUF420 domain-containing protein [Deltaproteobacteria bacterium]